MTPMPPLTAERDPPAPDPELTMPASRNSAFPRITVITPNLNGGAYLEQALCSVIDQGYENLEYIVVDGGSVDESVPVIQHYEEEISWWQSKADKGVGDAINQAVKRATGEWVLVVNADDLLLPGALHEAAKHLSATKADWCIGHLQRIGKSDGQIGRVTATAADSLESYLMNDGGYLPIQGSFFRRSLFEAHGGFDATFRFATGYEMSCRLIADGVRPEIMNLCVAAHRDDDASVSSQRVMQHGEEYIEIAERYGDQLEMKQRYALWKNCDERRRIYALAEAESKASDSRRFLWQQLLKRPWWLVADHYRETLLAGVAHPVEAKGKRKRAA